MDARTIFIPKKPDTVDPANFRPTMISSALVRLFHGILTKRIGSAVELSEKQRAFTAGIDSCGDNNVLLDSILCSRCGLSKSTNIATLAIAKAFRSVENSSILECSRAVGLPSPMIHYLEHYYLNGTSTLNGTDWVSPPI